MINCLVIVGIAIILLIFYIIFKFKNYDLKELFLNISISFLFVLLALVVSYKSNKFNVFNLLIIIGLLLGLLGDIFLDLKYIDTTRTKGYTYGGFISFGIGHILFIIAMLLMYGTSIPFIILAIILTIILSIATILLEKPLKLKYGEYKIISFLYALCLFGSLSFSLFLNISNRFQITSLNMLFIGFVLFVISDLVLSGTFFGENKERPIDFILNYITYYGAQFTIAFLLLIA